MAFKCIKKEWSTDFDGYIQKFICDTVADIENLPKCSPGSVAIVAAAGNPMFGINASGEWVNLNGSGGSGSETPGGGSGGASDCDWNIMKNKPFGEKVIVDKQLCIEPQTLDFRECTDMDNNPFPWTAWNLTEIGELDKAEVGDVAVVVIDGVEYVFEGQGNEGDMPYFGNRTIHDDTVVEPLYPDAKILIILGGMGGDCVFYLDASLIGKHEIAVYLGKMEETKLSYNNLADLPLYENVTKLVACEDKTIEITALERQDGPSSYVTVYGAEYISTIGALGVTSYSGMATLVDWKIKEGDKAIVVLDGEKHEFKFRSFKYTGSETLDFSIGNSELSHRGYNDGVVTDDNLYIASNSGCFEIFTTSDLVGTHTISIYAEQSEVKQLDSKFLPEHLQFGEEATFYDYYLTETEVMTSHSITFDDTFMALGEDGKHAIINIDGVEYPLSMAMDGDSGDFSDRPIDGYSVYITSSKIEGYVNVPEGETHTIAIYDKRVDYQRLDEKFMPTLTSPNGTKYKLTVSDDGSITAVVV